MLLDNRLAAQTTHFAMGTVMSHKAFGSHAEECLAAICTEVERLETVLSRFIPESDIGRVNRSAGMRIESISRDTWEILDQATALSSACQGCFAVTIGPLVNLWSHSKACGIPPDPSTIRRALALVCDRDLILDPRNFTAGLRKTGQSLDLGGIGKGYAGDRLLDIYQDYGITSAYSNLGGNVVTLGSRPDGGPWRIGIQHPRQEERILGCVSVVTQTVVTSGDYQRFFIDSQGKRRHHILDPQTGYPADSELVSVSIVTEQSLAADALSTGVFVAGMKKGLEMLSRFTKTEAILVNSDLQVFVTPGLRYRFQADEGVDVTVLD